MASASVGEDAAQLSKQHQATLHKPNGDWPNKAAPVVTPRPNTTAHKCSLRSQTAGCSPQRHLRNSPSLHSQVHSVTPADPLVQQFRCLCLLRERLKEPHWKHCEQLTAVQRYIDYEINEAVRRVLSFLFIVFGVVTTIALTFALCGMLQTLD